MAFDLALMIAGMFMIGYLAQWLAWRVRLPAIVFLLLAGIVSGPVLGLMQPDKIMGDLLFPTVSLAVAVILFEGSLSLRLKELSGIGSAVRGLVSYGAVITLVLLAAAAHYVAGIGWPIAFLFGALACVTGPTVIVPMLRTLRPNARIANTLRWEGIIIDPLGALFAVLAFELIVSRHEGHSVGLFLLTIVCGLAIGALAAVILAFFLRRHFIPDYLQSYAVLAAVLVVFAGSNAFAEESGLLAVTIMGITLGNLRGVHIEDILHFKENLTTVLVSVLFIMLSSRLPWPLPHGALWTGIGLFLIAQFIVRPLAAGIATLGSGLTWRERALIGWVAPRGIVAASVSALFALRLHALDVPGSRVLVPLVFILIIGTVILQSATARPLARWLKVAAPESNGLLIAGSDEVARAVGNALRDAGFPVLLADDDWDGIRQARMEGLATFYGNPVSPFAERHLDLSETGRVLAMSTHRERNSLVCVHFRQELGRERVYRLRNMSAGEEGDRLAFADDLQAPPLFDETMTHARFAELLDLGWRIKSTRLSTVYDWSRCRDDSGADSVLLFAVEEKGRLRVVSTKRKVEPKPNWVVLLLVPPRVDATHPHGETAAAVGLPAPVTR